jgi:hypothetical protein
VSQPSLLPYNRTPFEAAVEQVSAERYPLPTSLVSSLWSADDCPEHMLAYLAEQMSVDLWDDGWPEQKKRSVIRNSLQNHRLKTTPAGIKAHVAIVGAEVKKIIRPPAVGFMRSGMTEEQRMAWLDSLPQIRVYPFTIRSTAKRRRFCNGHGIKRQFYNGFARTSRGTQIYGKRATYYDRGVETVLTYNLLDDGTGERVFLQSAYPRRQWQGHGFYGRGYMHVTAAEPKVITFAAASAYQTFAIQAGLNPVNVRPQRISQQRTAPRPRGFFGRRGGFMMPSYAPRLIYDRIALNDPTRLGARHKVSAWYGRSRFGIAEFTAEVRISVPMRRAKRRAARWMGVGFLKAPDMSPLREAIQAVRVSKAFRDTVLINTTNFREVEFDGGLTFGDFDFGQIVEVD